MLEEKIDKSHKKKIVAKCKCDLESKLIPINTSITSLLVVIAILHCKYKGEQNFIRIGGKTAVIRIEDETEYRYSYRARGTRYSTDFKLEFPNSQKLKKNAGVAIKFWIWLMICINASAKHVRDGQIVFNLEDLVDYGMYKSLDAARLGLNTAWTILSQLEVSNIVQVDRVNQLGNAKSIPLVTRKIIKGNYCKLSLHPEFDLSVFGNFYSYLPGHIMTFDSRLIAVLYCLTYYVRKNRESVANEKEINLPIRYLHAWGQLPTDDSSKDTYNKIKKPINKIIDELKLLNCYAIEKHIDPKRQVSEFLDRGYISLKVKDSTIKDSLKTVEREYQKYAQEDELIAATYEEIKKYI